MSKIKNPSTYRQAGASSPTRRATRPPRTENPAHTPRPRAPLHPETNSRPTLEAVDKPERIAKYIARSGLCSRREAERMIAEKKVKVDGKIIDSPALNVTDENEILVNNKPLAAREQAKLWLYYKPRGLLTTRSDPEGRPTIFSALPEKFQGMKTVGRLDMNSEGLLLLTNDGGLKRYLELPSTGWARRYRVRVFGTPSPQTIAQLARGITIEGVSYRGAEVTVDKEGSNCWLTVTLREGKNREIRKLFEHFGHNVSRLIRMAYGPFQLGNLVMGDTRDVPRKALKEALGKGFSIN